MGTESESHSGRRGQDFLALGGIFLLALAFLLPNTMPTVFQARDLARASEWFSHPGYFGPEFSGGGHIPSPLYYVFLGLLLKLGLGWKGVAAVAGVLNLLGIGLFWDLLFKRFGRRVALLFVFLCLCNPVYLTYLLTNWNAVFYLPFVLLAYWFPLRKVLDTSGARARVTAADMLGAALASAVAMGLHFSAGVAFMALGAFLLLRQPEWGTARALLLGAGIMGATTLPYYLWKLLGLRLPPFDYPFTPAKTEVLFPLRGLASSFRYYFGNPDEMAANFLKVHIRDSGLFLAALAATAATLGRAGRSGRQAFGRVRELWVLAGFVALAFGFPFLFLAEEIRYFILLYPVLALALAATVGCAFPSRPERLPGAVSVYALALVLLAGCFARLAPRLSESAIRIRDAEALCSYFNDNTELSLPMIAERLTLVDLDNDSAYADASGLLGFGCRTDSSRTRSPAAAHRNYFLISEETWNALKAGGPGAYAETLARWVPRELGEAMKAGFVSWGVPLAIGNKTLLPYAYPATYAGGAVHLPLSANTQGLAYRHETDALTDEERRSPPGLSFTQDRRAFTVLVNDCRDPNESGCVSRIRLMSETGLCEAGSWGLRFDGIPISQADLLFHFSMVQVWEGIALEFRCGEALVRKNILQSLGGIWRGYTRNFLAPLEFQVDNPCPGKLAGITVEVGGRRIFDGSSYSSFDGISDANQERFLASEFSRITHGRPGFKIRSGGICRVGAN